MNRRTLLRAGGGATLGALVVGCLGDGRGGDGGRETDTGPTDTASEPTTRAPTTAEPPTADPPTTTDGGFEWPAEVTPFEEVTVGDRATVEFPENNRAIAVDLWNAVDAERTLALRATTPDDAPGLRRDVAFPAGGVLSLSLAEPDSYTLSLGSLGSLSVPFAAFDCNHTAYAVRLGADRIDHRWAATEIACPDAELGEVAVESGAGDCGTSDRATVAFADGAVVVEGSMRTPDPCHDVRVRGADHDPDRDVLTLALEAVARDTGCVDCVGQVPYEVRARFANDYPREVVVRHGGPEGGREVARVSRDGAG